MKFLRSTVRQSLVAVAVSFAISVIQPALASNKQLQMIPDDTLFYFGTDKPVAVEDLFSMLPGGFGTESLREILPEIGSGDEEIVQKIEDFLKDPAALASEWGLGDEVQFSAYTVGVMPVFRLSADPEQFESAFKKATANGDVTFDMVTHKGIDIRVLPLDEESDKKSDADSGPTEAELVAARENIEQALSDVKVENRIAAQALEEANSNLESAKTKNDASGIAQAANEIAEAAGKVSKSSSKQSRLEEELAQLDRQAEDAQKMQAAGGKSGPGFITASVENDLVFAIASNAYDPDVLDQLLGLTDIEVSLQDSGKVKKIRSEWDYGDEMAMFVDMKLIADAVTGGDSLAAQQLKTFSASAEGISGLKTFSVDPCKAEVRQFAEFQPMIVSGNRRFEVNGDSVDYDSHFAVILENEPLLSTLKLLRGAVPVSQSSSETMLSMGLGLNVDTAPQLSAQLTDLISGINYKCEVFAGLNELAKTDVSALSMGAVMFGGMARGVKGISFNIYNGDMDTSAAIPVKGIDGAITIAAEDPAALMQTLRILPQFGALADLPLDGTPVSLNNLIPVPMPDDAELFAAVKDKNIVLYSGDEAEDFANRLSGNGEEGFIFSTINTRKLISKFNQIVDQLPESIRRDNELDKFAGFMKAYPTGNLSYKIDFTDKGIEFEAVGQIDRPEK